MSTLSVGDMASTARRRVVVGDVHGELSGLRSILRHASLIDAAGRWAGAETALIQTGDVIDRGPHTWECVRLLRDLQRQALDCGGEVVRLCGNHELWLMMGAGHFVQNAYPDPEKLGAEFRKDVASGTLKAAHSDGRRFYTHAVLRSRVRDHLYDEMGVKGSSLTRRADIGALAEHINGTFRDFVCRGKFDGHPIFWIDSKRGGRDHVGGIFWCDYTSISPSERAGEIPQVFGHSPSFNNKLRHTASLKLINVDAGMTEIYGGHRVYLEITPAGELVQHALKAKNTTRWSRVVLGRE